MEGNFAVVELGLGLVVPTVMFLRPSVRRSPRLLLLASWLAIGGVVLNRFDIVMTGMTRSIGLGFYAPHVLEVAFVVGMASAVAVAYLFIVENFPILPEETFAERGPVLHERRIVTLRSDRETVPERGEAGVPVGAGTSGDR
jgi:Ni/Fe-hydrogenase subunit HybB-like protein